MKRILAEQQGQATAEYALVMVAAAVIAGALIFWATNSGALSALFDAVVERISTFV
jgi:Flp pilus assembly pilin Flp